MSETKLRILRAAVLLVSAGGLSALTLQATATKAEVGHSLVSYHFGSIDALRGEVMRYAVTYRVLRVVACGVVSGHPVALAADIELQRQAMAEFLPS